MISFSALEAAILFGEALAVMVLVAALFRRQERLGSAPYNLVVGALAALSIVVRQIDIGPYTSTTPLVLLGACLFALALVDQRDGFVATRSLVHGLCLVALVAIPVGLLLALDPLGRLRSALIDTAPAASPTLPEGVAGAWVAGAFLSLLAPIVFCLTHALLSKPLAEQPAVRTFLSILFTLGLDRSLDAARVAPSGLLQPIREGLASAFPALVAVPLAASLVLIVLVLRHGRGVQLGTEQQTPQRPAAVLSGLLGLDATTGTTGVTRTTQGEPRDASTGLRNRLAFDTNLPREVERALRLEIELGLMMVSIDDFDSIVEHYGAEEAEEIVRRAAWALRNVLRQTELPCRFAEDRFAIILQGANAQTARFLAKRIQKLFRDGDDDAPTIEVPATLTISAASVPNDTTLADALVDLASERLGEGQASGRDRVVWNDGGDSGEA